MTRPYPNNIPLLAAAGVDIIEIERIVRLAARGTSYLERVFTPGELILAADRQDWAQFLAGRFAAKEAVAKCIGPPLGWHEVEVLSTKDGSPNVILHGRARAKAAAGSLLVSISHCRGYAIAFAVLQSSQPGDGQ